MLKNFITIFYRNYSKNPLYSFLNTFGLAVGFAVTILAILFIQFHLNYNNCHDDYDKIYRIHNGFTMNGESFMQSSSLIETGERIFENVPEVENFTRITNWYSESSLIKAENIFFNNIDILIVDSNFLELFSYKLVLGSKSDFLKHANQIAITEKLSKSLFGNENPIEKRITFDGREYIVGWIIQDPAVNAHIQFDLLLPYDAFDKNWFSFDIFTYLRFKDYPDENIEQKIIDITNTCNKERFAEYGTDFKAEIMSLKDIYLHSDFGWEPSRTENIRNLYIFGFLGLLILIIAIINYVNLLTAKSEERSKEVGLRKVVGASKSQLRNHFLGESMFITIISFCLSLVLVEFLIHPINELLNIKLSLIRQSSFLVILILISIPIICGLLSGYYPALILSRFQPISVIKGIFKSSGNPNFLKVLLVIIQFSFSTLLIAVIIIFIFQINFVKTKDLGFNPKNLVMFSRITPKIQDQYLSVKNELIANPYIEEVTASHGAPGMGGSGQLIYFKNTNPKTDAIGVREFRTQDNFVKTFGIELLAGRTFSYDNYRDSNVFILNEEAVKHLGDPNPIGKTVNVASIEGKIIGIVKDFHFYNLRENIRPLVLSRYGRNDRRIITLKLNPNNRKETINFIINKLKEYDIEYYPSFNFSDDIFKEKYEPEEKMLEIIIWGSIIAIILSILGLFALTSFTIHKKYKEIGIRKIQGASVSSIVFLLNKNILRWVLLTNLIAWPVGYYLMEKWLQNFAYHINLNLWYFFVASIISFVIALLTITFQSKRAASLNPAEIIKYE
jgi:putative ABC transport system permease protein